MCQRPSKFCNFSENQKEFRPCIEVGGGSVFSIGRPRWQLFFTCPHAGLRRDKAHPNISSGDVENCALIMTASLAFSPLFSSCVPPDFAFHGERDMRGNRVGMEKSSLSLSLSLLVLKKKLALGAVNPPIKKHGQRTIPLPPR